jgi:hypothetical protein
VRRVPALTDAQLTKAEVVDEVASECATETWESMDEG